MESMSPMAGRSFAVTSSDEVSPWITCVWVSVCKSENVC